MDLGFEMDMISFFRSCETSRGNAFLRRIWYTPIVKLKRSEGVELVLIIRLSE